MLNIGNKLLVLLTWTRTWTCNNIKGVVKHVHRAAGVKPHLGDGLRVCAMANPSLGNMHVNLIKSGKKPVSRVYNINKWPWCSSVAARMACTSERHDREEMPYMQGTTSSGSHVPVMGNYMIEVGWVFRLMSDLLAITWSS